MLFFKSGFMLSHSIKAYLQMESRDVIIYINASNFNQAYI